MSKYIFLLVSILVQLSLFAQQGNNYAIELSNVDNFSSKKNVAFYPKHVEKTDNSVEASFITKEFDVPKNILNQDFIALNTQINYTSLLGPIELFYKVKTGKKWSTWESIKIDDHGNSLLPTIYGLPAYLPVDATKIQLKVSAAENTQFQLEKLQFRYYFPGEDSPVVENKKKGGSQEKAVNCNCPIPSIQYRLDWCPSGNCPKDLTPTATTVTHLVVHHSAGSNTSTNWAATVRSIWDYHVNSRGWDDVGYNFLIDPDGVIYEGRGNDVSGAHFSCMNPGTMGVCLLGNLNTVGPTPEMINSLTELLGWKACDIDEDPRDTSFFTTGSVNLINLCGHRDGNNIPASCTVTECPGNNMYAVMDNLRSSVYNYTQTCTLSPSYSDIVVLSMDATPSTIYTNEVAQLNLAYKNIGDEGVLETLQIDFEIDGTNIGTQNFTNLAVNETKNASLNYTFPSAGTYQYCAYIDGASNEFNTSNNSFCINVAVIERPDTSTGIYDLLSAGVKVYPNPASSLIYIESESPLQSFIIYNTLGQRVLEATTSPIDISSLTDGLYSLKVLDAKNTSFKAFKFIKQ